jgi:hypothetical protein
VYLALVKDMKNEKQKHGGSRGQNVPLNTTLKRLAEEVGSV